MPGVAQQRFTQCDHCGEVENAVHLKEWQDSEGTQHAVHHAEVDEYLAALREQHETRRLDDGTRVI